MTLPITCKIVTVTSARYLGVTVTIIQDLSWDQHINNICAKAYKTLGFLCCNIKLSTSKLKQASLVTRPLSFPYWSRSVQYVTHTSMTQHNINNIEAVHRIHSVRGQSISEDI